MKHLKLFFALFAMLALGVGNAWGATITINGSASGITTIDGNQIITVDGITFKGKFKQYSTTALWFTSGSGYIYNTTSLGTINSITINYKSGGSESSKQYFTSGTSEITSYQSGDAQITTSTGGTAGTHSSFSGGFFNISISNKNLQATSIVIDYTPAGGGETPGGGEDPTPDPEDPEPPGTDGESSTATFTYIDLQGQGASSTGAEFTGATKDPIFMSGKGYCKSTNSYVQIYANNYLTFTPTNATITKIVLTAATDYIKTWSASEGTIEVSEDKATWTGSSTSTVTLTNTATAQARITQMDVTYTASGSDESEAEIVKTLNSIAVSDMTTIYEQGGEFSFDGKCTATYSVTKDGVAQADQTAKVEPTSVSTPDMNQLGTQTVTVTYTEGEVTKTAEYTITIEEAPTYNFTKIDMSEWGTGYNEHVVTYEDATVTFASASKQSGTITDQPVTKGGDVSLVLTDGMNIATVKWVCTQWTTKAQSITLHYSKDGGNVYTSTEITSSDFTISSDNLPAGTNAVKITFNSTSNQVGIKSCTITKVEAAAITQVPAPQFSLQGGAYDGVQSVELTCTMADATIHYTTDGTTPTTSSPIYSTAIQVTENMTIKAYAVKEGLEDSPVVEATYEISAPADVVLDFTTNTWLLPEGNANKATEKTDFTNGDYTVSIAAPTAYYFDSNNLFLGKKDAYIVLPVFNKPIVKIVCEGVSSGSGSVTFNVFVDDEAVSTAVTSCKVDQTFLVAEDKQVANVAHVIKVTNENNLRIAKIKIYLGEAPAVEKPVIAGEEEFVTSTQVSITCTTSGAKIYFTTDGTIPTTSSTEYTAPFELSATTTVKAIAYVDGQSSVVATKTFTSIETITCVQASEIALAQSENNLQTEKKYRIIAYVTETLSGVSSNQQSFKVVDNIGDESVFQSYYCNVPEAMAAGMKVEMIGKLSKYNTTAQMKNGDVTILEKPVAAPKILGVEAFETSTEVTITAEEGMQIYYTLDGTTPTTGSTQYTAAFTLSATTTVKAIAYNSATAKSSAVAEKTFTKTTIPTKTVDEFIAEGGTRCYLEGIVSDIDNTTYGNFNLTDASGTIYVYGCLNASGESKKFAELEVKEGDKIKVIADEYEFYQGTKHEAKNVQYVSHISAATIEVSNITMEVGETQTIAATITPDAAETAVVYTIKENTDNAISLSDNTITALAPGTATIIATIAETESYLGITKEFTVVVTAADPELSWTSNTVELGVGETFTAPTLNNPYNVTGITYSSDNELLATVDASTGVVSLVPDATGTATITATFAGDGTYKAVEASYTITVTPALVYGVWELVMDVASLAAGDKVVIVAKDYNFALSTNQKSNNRGQAAVTKNSNTISFSADVQVLTLETGSKENTFALYTGNGYLYASSTSSNHLKTQAKKDDNASWNISIADGTATIVAQGTNTINTMQYNQSSSLFACYASASQKAVCLYTKKNVKVEGETDNSAIPNQSDVTVDNAELSVTTEAEYDNMYIGNNGSVNIEEELTVNNLYIQTTMGTTTSGQLNTAPENLIVNGDAFIDITLGKNGDQNQWHAFTVPFLVDAMNGVYDLNDNQLKNEVDYAIMDYHGDIRANGQYGWKKYRGILVPGTFYLMTVDGARTTYRFKKVKGEAIVASATKAITAYTGSSDDTKDKGWNGVGNPTLMYGKVGYKALILNPESYTYELILENTAYFTVGTPFFIQAATDGTMTMVAETSASLAPARHAATAVENIKVMLGNSDYTDYLYVSASEDATNEYEIGKDLAKMTMTKTPSVPQIFAEAYNTSLCMIDAPMANNEAVVALNLYAPADGEYTISTDLQENAIVYLMQEGTIVWNLSMGEYPITLKQGDNAGYSLVVRRADAPTDVENILGADEQTEKFIYNGKLYILHNGKIFDAVGSLLK